MVRTPPEVSLYHRHDNPLFRDVLERLGRDAHLHAVVLPRTAEQRESILAAGLALQQAGVVPASVDVKKTVDDLIDDRYVTAAN